MNWFSDLVGKVTKKETIDFYVSKPLPLGKDAPISAPVAEDTYVTVSVASLRLPNTRQNVVEKVYGVVHAFASVPSRFGESNEFASATMPGKIAGVDSRNLEKVIAIDKLVVGPTPWSNGALNLQIGLFSVVSENLAGAFLGTLTKLTDTVGVGFAATAKPYVEALRFGIEQLTGVEGSVKLEIGADKTYTPPSTGYFALVAAPYHSLDGKSLSVDPDDKKLLVDGQHYTAKPYLIFSIASSSQRSDWGKIPELKASYDAIRQAVVANDRNKAEDCLRVFSRLTAVSSDLIPADAKALVLKAEAMMKQAFGSADTSGAPRAVPTFAELNLYAGR